MNYVGLRIYGNDTDVTKRWKRKAVTDLLRLRAALRAPNETADISRAPGIDERRLRIATWNIREFDTPNYAHRLDEAYYYLAEVISAFDLVALQEVKGDLAPFDRLLRILGRDWAYVMTDADESSAAHNERMVFVYDTRRVQFRGTAGEINLSGGDRLQLSDSYDLRLDRGVEIELPPGSELRHPEKVNSEKVSDGDYRITPATVVDLPEGTRINVPEGSQLAFKGRPDEFSFDIENGRIANKRLDLKEGDTRSFSEEVRVRFPAQQMELGSQQFARTPFIAYFQSEWMKLALCTVHIYYGSNSDGSPQMARRRAEIEALTEVLAKKASEKTDSDANSYFIALGDFNIKGHDHQTMAALRSNDFEIPEQIQAIPAGTNVKRDMYYDQIAFWQGTNDHGRGPKDYTEIKIVDAGIFDVFKHVYRHGEDDSNGEDEEHFRARMEDVGRTYTDYSAWRTHQISDHLPMWVEIETDFADAYLASLLERGEA
ncbi:endonuclease/exonuclease/phosphatase family protein [Sulfitobacter sp. M57]|uniref:endonuclease/exonuclease/phosphatase family protein n=1 Tax=unclassified Sulfitobacter TaxID=196795 RepID=UPI0023E1F15E|nr:MULTISPECIES: endonuclease/exonuclease/phosphatase family protein [unclassified Sulfitobacter]MDF3416358.1 endonuclease/exonuclease/phosphatase family protein [Sulfitobacter sp. KE5]MDF3423837.1 endonuclease/exonuclease/phosphatase family protein [Sulfitobacter sp. KE43]MDF3434904.1 endonuclease/exonuclease/phosphatase family protein [Sulfitobacter sp. KE42]MDF3460543.1 endonuclease/exonuclease/phosphatase family protein [Sulfitobacter sp. S74]MDF3464441.1 endonuclease/exonuclease/phosphata